MATVDMASILAKANAYLNSSAGKNRIKKETGNAVLKGNGVHSPIEAAQKFIQVLRLEIASSGLSSNAIVSISNLNYGGLIDYGDGTYTIYVYFNSDMSRPSLDEARFGRVSNIALLLNNGVDHEMRQVHGVWHGQEMWSRTTIPGTHFIEQAITDFMSNYGSEYNVVSIEPTILQDSN